MRRRMPGILFAGVRRRILLVCGQAAIGTGEKLVVTDAQRLDPALLAKRQPDEEAELNKLFVGEVFM